MPDETKKPVKPAAAAPQVLGRRIRLKRDNQVTHAKDSVMRLAKEGDVVDAIVQDANHLISLGFAEAAE